VDLNGLRVLRFSFFERANSIRIKNKKNEIALIAITRTILLQHAPLCLSLQNRKLKAFKINPQKRSENGSSRNSRSDISRGEKEVVLNNGIDNLQYRISI